MKNQLVIIVFCLLNLHAYAQDISLPGSKNQESTNPKQRQKEDKSILGNALIKCSYLFIRKEKTTEKPSGRDTMILLAGNQTSRFYDPARLGRDSLMAARLSQKNLETIKTMNVYKNQDFRDISNMPGTIGSKTVEGESYQIYKDKTANKITIVDYTSSYGKFFQYEDPTGPLPWKISSETDTILSYTCQKATLNFRGRDYTAWFSTEIPISDGPWKFMGLPGLILKIEDSQQLFSFSLIGLEQLTKPQAIILSSAEHIKCTRAEFLKLKAKQGGPTLYNFNAGNLIVSQLPANPATIQMELE